MATEYCLIYKYTGQDNTSSARSVALSKFSISGDTNKRIGKVTRIKYEHWHTSTKSMTWNLRGQLVLSDGTNLISDTVGINPSGDVVKFVNTFTFDTPLSKTQFDMITHIQTLNSQGTIGLGDGYYADLYWRATSDYPMCLYVYFIEAGHMMYGVDDAWKECEVFFGVDGAWQQVTPHFGVDGVWKQT